MKKKICIIVVLVLILAGTVPVYGAGTDDYKLLVWNISGDMGTYSPGTYVISSSSFSETQKNILDGMNMICRTRIGRFVSMGGCNYVAAANIFVRFVPNASYSVVLYDANTGGFVWRGTLRSGEDLYLGTDHTAYHVFFTSENGNYFTCLFRK